MPSTYTASARFVLEAPGENLNTWGTILNTGAISLIDFAVAGRTALALSGTVTLTSNNGSADQARSAILDFTSGTGGTVTIPAVSKVYAVRNNCSGSVIFTTGSGATATVETGNMAFVMCNGTDCYRLTQDAADVATCLAAAKAYTDAAAFSAAAGTLPGQGGNSGKFLQTNGTAANWVSAVASFNTRVGAVTLTSGDVTSALTYTPLNKAGDTATGAMAFLAISGTSGSFSSTVSAAGFTGPLTGAVTGNASTASKWATARALSYTGDATGSGSVDGSGDVATTLTLATVNSNVGSFANATLTVNAKGLVTAASASPVATTSVAGPTTLATGAQVITGSDTTHAVTPASLTSLQSLGASGYLTLPGGTVVQWGNTGNVTGGSPQTISFPQTFPNAVWRVLMTRTSASGAAQAADAITARSTAGFTANNGAAGNTTTFDYLAIGN